MKQSSIDQFLGGRIIVRQPLEGFRSGLDAVMVAASVPAGKGDEILELGSGVGVASLCIAARVEGCRISGVELVPELVEAACANVAANRMEARVCFEQGDVFQAAHVQRRQFDHVFCNPPFYGSEGIPSRSRERVLALDDAGRFCDWLGEGLRRVREGGTLTAIVPPDRLSDVLRTLPPRGVAILPLWPRAKSPAKRLIVQTVKNSRAPLLVLPGLVLHDEVGRYTDGADAVLRHAGSLAVKSPRL